MSTAKGVRRSRWRVSVKLMKSDWSTGHRVKAANSRQKGAARIQAAAPAPSRRRRRGAGPTSAGARVVVSVMSHSCAGGLRLLLDRLQLGGRVRAGLGDLLHGVVERGDHLLPSGERRGRLGGLELLAEDRELLVALQRLVLPG